MIIIFLSLIIMYYLNDNCISNDTFERYKLDMYVSNYVPNRGRNTVRFWTNQNILSSYMFHLKSILLGCQELIKKIIFILSFKYTPWHERKFTTLQGLIWRRKSVQKYRFLFIKIPVVW